MASRTQLLASIVLRSAVVAAAAPKPHILLILADDYGWANIGVHRRGQNQDPGQKQGAAEVRTPNLDALAGAGVTLDRHYSYKICSPSRSSLQTGRLATHVNTVNTGVTVRNTSDPVSGWSGIPRNMTGVAQKLRSAGYRTHMVGKWDAGMATPEHTPLGRGYESWLGYFQHANDYWHKTMGIQSTGEIDNCLNMFADFFMHNASYRGGVRDGSQSEPRCLSEPTAHPECYEEYPFKERALQIVREHDLSKADEPLFLFYSFHVLHTPLQVPQTYLDKLDRLVAEAGASKIEVQNRRLYAAMTLYMDDAVGEVVAALKARRMWDDTLVVFTSDNGGPVYEPGAANNFPLKGGKYSDWEGGVRVNTFVSGGFVPPLRRGSSFTGVVSVADWYGTFCELAGVDPTDTAAAEANEWLKPRGLPLLHPVDSVPQWGFILNGTNGRPGPLHISEKAVLHWPYKLVVGKQPFSKTFGPLYPNCSTVHGLESEQGPVPPDLKVFDVAVELGKDTAQQDKLTWVQDCGPGHLFDVEKDPSELQDLSNDPRYRGTLQQLQSALLELNKDLFSPWRGEICLEACEKAIDIGGYYGPFAHVGGWYTPVPSTPGQYQKDDKLKTILAGVNADIAKKGVVKAMEKFTPMISDWWMSSMDKCEKESLGPRNVVPAAVVHV